MSEHLNQNVAAIFRKGDHILVPPDPVGLQFEDRLPNETYEKTLNRIVNDHGLVYAKIDMVLPKPNVEDMPTQSYLLTDPEGKLDRSEFFVHPGDLMQRIFEHPNLRPVDVALFTTALYAIQAMPSSQTRIS